VSGHAGPNQLGNKCSYLSAAMLSRTRLVPSDFIEPCLPSPAERPAVGPTWVHEIKHDGYRLMARRDGAGVRLPIHPPPGVLRP
jgi:ATP-dependent DNA ligase